MSIPEKTDLEKFRMSEDVSAATYRLRGTFLL